MLLALVFVSGSVILADLGNLFEVEDHNFSNMDFDGTAIQDWENALNALSDPNTIVANGNPPAAEDNPALEGEAILFFDDISSSSLTDGSTFTTGSKETSPSLDPNDTSVEDPENGVTDWDTVASNVPPNKDDISTVYIWHDAPLDNLVLAMERLNNLGDSHLDFGVDHRPWVPCVHDETELCPQRTAGDLVLAFDLTNGGEITTLRVFKWEIPGDGIQVGPTDGCDGQIQGGGNLSKSCVGGKSGATRYGWEEISIDPGVAFHGTNADDIAAGPWGSFGQGAVRRSTIPARGFFESYVNLDALDFVPLCAGAATLSVRSRSSASIDSSLQDLAGPIDLGGGDITVDAEVTGSCDLTFTYNVTAEDIDGTDIDPNGLVCDWDCEASDPSRILTFDEEDCIDGEGTVDEGDGQPVTITCTVHVSEAVLACEGDGGDDGDVFTPLEVTIAASPTSRSCTVPGTPGSNAGDIGQGIVFTRTITGGSGVNTTTTWTLNGPNDVDANTFCGLATTNDSTCKIDIPDSSFCGRTNVQAEVDDDVCESADSNVMHVEKETTETASSGS